MKITNKHTGFSFNLSEKEAADFFYCKNARGEYINTRKDYTIEDERNEISTFKFFMAMVGLVALTYCSLYFYFQWNY